MPQERRSYSKSFKALDIAEGVQADTSIVDPQPQCQSRS